MTIPNRASNRRVGCSRPVDPVGEGASQSSSRISRSSVVICTSLARWNAATSSSRCSSMRVGSCASMRNFTPCGVGHDACRQSWRRTQARRVDRHVRGRNSRTEPPAAASVAAGTQGRGRRRLIARISRGRRLPSSFTLVRKPALTCHVRSPASVVVRLDSVRDAEVGSSNLPHPTKVNSAGSASSQRWRPAVGPSRNS